MHAAMYHGPGDIRWQERPDPRIELPGDAVVRVVASCVCGSDLWGWRGKRPPASEARPIGHEFVGIVEQTGSGVSTVSAGDFVIAPFLISDNTCVNCRNGFQTSCLHGQAWGGQDADGRQNDGGQGQYVRVPLADGTLVKTPGLPATEQIPALLALSDVMGTGHHAAVMAGVEEGSTVAVVGDGAVGLCAVLAAARLRAGRVIALGRNPARIAVARQFGATDVVEARGDEAVAAVLELTDGLGVSAVLECVGTQQAMDTAIAITRDGGSIGFVGVPAEVDGIPPRPVFGRNLGVRGGVAPVRAYLPELLNDVLDGRLDPSPVFDRTVDLRGVPDGYAAMDDRSALKVLVRP
jgi:threonine dehydrogenase-like Zn-dependent dehydrogenase